MRLRDYLAARDESEAAFGRRAGIPQKTVNQIACGAGCYAKTAEKIIRASKEEPAPGGGTVTLEDLIGDPQARAAG